MSRLSRYKQSKIIGSGVWYSGHMLSYLAAESKDPKDFDLAYGYTEKIRMYFPCGKCRSHINEFCLTNDPERFLENKDAEGLVEWWFNLHNNANRHAGNPEEKKEDVKKFFTTEEGMCDLNCDGSSSEPIFTKINEPILPSTRKNAPGITSLVKGNFKNVFSTKGELPLTSYVNIMK